MSITYTWKIDQLDTIPSVEIGGVTYENVVSAAHWRLVGEDENGNTASVYGSMNLNYSDIDSGTFVPLANITAQTMVTWATALMDAAGEGTVQGHKDAVAAQIAEKVTPSRVSVTLENNTVAEADLP